MYKKLLVSDPNPGQSSSLTCLDNVAHSLHVFVFDVHKQHCVRLASLEICILNLNSVNQLIFVMVKCGVLFEVRTEYLNNI
jgi:hypothetical protein